MTTAEARQILHALDAAYRNVSGTVRDTPPVSKPGVEYSTVRLLLSQARQILIAEIQNAEE